MEVKELEFLTKLAQKYDDEGLTEEASKIDSLIMSRFAKEDKKEEGRAMSNKAKAKFRAVQKACQSLCDADLDYRGAHKKECRKVEMLAEDILDALKECDLG